ncbi:MAG TPA: hypothetical protein VJI97_03215 [Candidatus Nanoarchaeia archaeon]|nr:hypothetical protein [Candidatus Nanoarchaeia archaeon]
MISRKSQGMPLNVIIIAVLGLIVLVVLAVMFSGKSREFSAGISSCAAKQGTCQNNACGADQVTISGGCPEKGQSTDYKYCCAKVLG